MYKWAGPRTRILERTSVRALPSNFPQDACVATEDCGLVRYDRPGPGQIGPTLWKGNERGGRKKKGRPVWLAWRLVWLAKTVVLPYFLKFFWQKKEQTLSFFAQKLSELWLSPGANYWSWREKDRRNMRNIFCSEQSGRNEIANTEQKSSHLWRCGIEGIKGGIWWRR
jgi:hypothetical protein